MRAFRLIAMLISLPALAGCAPGGASCLLPQQRAMLQIDMFFGRSIEGRGPVSDGEWEDFARRVITPRFPDGFTVLDGHGQWMDPATRSIDGEPSKMVRIDTVAGADTALRVQAVADAYKAAFHQYAVGIATSAVCAAF